MSQHFDMCAARDVALLVLESESSAEVRAEAADSLCELAFKSSPAFRPEFEAAVVRLLSDKQDEVRCAGLALAAEVLSPVDAKSILVRHLTDEVTRVRVEAAGRLADLALPDARGALAAALGDVELTVRFEAARGMVALEHSAGFDVLLEALEDVDLRFRAASALAQLGNKKAIEPIKRVFTSWFLPAFDKTQFAGALAALGDAEGVEHLFKRAGRKWTMDRSMAVELLGEVRAAGALVRLTEIIQDKADPARGAAARGLGRLGDASAEATLSALLGSDEASDELKLDAAEGLLLLGIPSARERVLGLHLKDEQAAQELAALIKDYETP